jgi:hypothetical protein
VSSNTLTGVTVLNGSGTVSTGDTVTQITPLAIVDMLGNLIYPTAPFPTLIGYAQFLNATTTTSTSTIPVPKLVAPFIIPPGAPRRVKVTLSSPFFTSSAVAGSADVIGTTIGNSSTGASVASFNGKLSVSSDGTGIVLQGIAPTDLAAGLSTATASMSQGAAGTLTLSLAFGITCILVELV